MFGPFRVHGRGFIFKGSARIELEASALSGAMCSVATTELSVQLYYSEFCQCLQGSCCRDRCAAALVHSMESRCGEHLFSTPPPPATSVESGVKGCKAELWHICDLPPLPYQSPSPSVAELRTGTHSLAMTPFNQACVSCSRWS